MFLINIRLDNYPHALELVPECYKTQKMSDKVVTTYYSTKKIVPECLLTQEMCDKAVNRCFFYLILILISMKLKKCVTGLLLKILF